MPPRKRKTAAAATVVAKKAKTGAKTSKPDGGDATVADSTVHGVEKVIQFTGKVPVDEHAHLLSAEVFIDNTGIAWDCLLNQTNIGPNNNKFYLMQILKTGPDAYILYRRWGRVGNKGQMGSEQNSDATALQKEFVKIFTSKTKNAWPVTKKFEKYNGKYDYVKRDYSISDGDDNNGAGDSIPPTVDVPNSKLHIDVQQLIQFICDVKSIENELREMKYDPAKSPLGKLSVEQIKLGYSALKTIEDCIRNNQPGDQLEDACSTYYTRIPHVFSARQIPLVDTMDKLKSEMTLLSCLEDAQAAVRILAKQCATANPIDRHYDQLQCDIQAMEDDSDVYKLIAECFTTTHSKKNHNYGMKVLKIFAMHRENETKSFTDHGNRRLLWHGSRRMNWAGIMGRGLKIAPPEAPVTGYMFGKGVYFADVSSKSGQYCYPDPVSKLGLMMLTEVSLGDSHNLTRAEYNLPKKLPAGKKSTFGVGMIKPFDVKKIQGTDAFYGPLVDQDENLLTSKKSSLRFNEFIVYNTDQIRMKYLLLLEFS